MGTILAYTGNLDKIPSGWSLCDGTNGTPDLRGRFLEGMGTHSVCSYIAPGLPNIIGETNIDMYASWLAYASGAFVISGTAGAGDDGTGSGDVFRVRFDASRSSSIYGASTTVQPSAYVVYYIMKTK